MAAFVPSSGVAPLGPQILKGAEPSGDSTGDEQSPDISEVVSVQMPDEDFVQEGRWDLEGKQAFGRPCPNIEDELLAVAELHEEAGRCLCRTRRRHSRAAGDDSYLIGCELFAVGRVEIPCARLDRRDHGRPCMCGRGQVRWLTGVSSVPAVEIGRQDDRQQGAKHHEVFQIHLCQSSREARLRG